MAPYKPVPENTLQTDCSWRRIKCESEKTNYQNRRAAYGSVKSGSREVENGGEEVRYFKNGSGSRGGM